MQKMELNKLVRENIVKLEPYSSARDEYTGTASVFLDANENPFNAPFNRYPDPRQLKLKQKIAGMKGIMPECLFLGNGSDEAIDILIRIFCKPATDNIISIVPSYGMYRVCADVNDIRVQEVPLNTDFQLDTEALLAAVDSNTKLMFICSPNNPTGNCFRKEDIKTLLDTLDIPLIIDEAYIDFSPENTFLPELSRYENLVILQTFSKAWGMAGIRLGMAMATKEIIALMNKVKYPYNISILTQLQAFRALKRRARKDAWVKKLLLQRKKLQENLIKTGFVKKIFPTDANFMLVQVADPADVYDYLIKNRIVVRNRSKVILCEGCLRITVGKNAENALLLKALKNYRK
jgi:histidinol-phosphate aminotransferase